MIGSGQVTRQTLLRLRSRRRVLENGLELLRGKRQALMKEMYSLMVECIDRRDELAVMLSRAFRELELARGFLGDAVESAAAGARRNVRLDIRFRNVWGIKIPEIVRRPVVRSIEAGELSPLGESAGLLDARRRFEKVVDAVVAMASGEKKLQRLAAAVRADTIRINAIEEVVLPMLSKRIREIRRVLEEREREEVFRLKRYKSRGR
ncbi:MAG TPA: V-type ATP synthase subunit D [Deltaproteobacteria bacterium]|nr:V-type ATP synthase subunit D [Deltaproteobacteria bacterium]